MTEMQVPTLAVAVVAIVKTGGVAVAQRRKKTNDACTHHSINITVPRRGDRNGHHPLLEIIIPRKAQKSWIWIFLALGHLISVSSTKNLKRWGLGCARIGIGAGISIAV